MKHLSRLLFTALLLAPAAAFAHTGTGHLAGFGDGFGHPLTGLDHMLAMIAVGIWAFQTGGRAVWGVPLAFVVMMVGGGLLGLSGTSLPFAEQGIVMSVLFLGLVIAAAVRFPVVAGMAIAGIFAVFHGHAHGTEMPAVASGMAYAAGFTVSTALLHLGGIGAGMLLQGNAPAYAIRYSGAAIALCGVWLAF